MKSYYFILGRENKISQKELVGVLASFDFGFEEQYISILSDEVLEIKLDATSSDIKILMSRLGGTVKIFEKIASADENIAKLLMGEDSEKKIILGISNYSQKPIDTFKLALGAKKHSKKSVRVVAGKENDRLSSAQSFQYKMTDGNVEYGIFDTGIGKLVAVQDIDEWTRHDYGKPRSDALSGMLPPKLARMIVNLAVSSSEIKDPIVVDPFCGSGNILIEALAIGCDVIGSDLSEKAVSDTQENVAWFKSDKSARISQSDATAFDFSQIDQGFVIATEPYLGQPRKAKLRIEDEKLVREESIKLYESFFRNLKQTEKKLKALAIVFPVFELANGKHLSIFNECVDFVSSLGYTTICSPLIYGRDYQVVKREIVILKQNGT